ncbi:MAG: CotH kinase family protein [Lachnospiraceae bacterium]|nr:CotH kinase family protein [Lachnospiraceae bacterium]
MKNVKQNLGKVFFAICLLFIVSPMVHVNASAVTKGRIPRVYIETQNSIVKESYVDASITVVDKKDGVFADVTDDLAKIKIRGNSTAQAAKKPYNIKFDSKQDLFGMGEDKKWSLMANAFDKSFIRNAMALDMARNLGLTNTSQYVFVEVYLNGAYNGLYMLTEPVDVSKNRVDISEKNGDYLFEYEKDRYEEGQIYITTNDGYRFVTDNDELNAEQVAELTNMMNAAEAAIDSKNYDNISEAIDVESFIKLYTVEDVFKNVDVHYSSLKYYFKDGKLYAGPAWDFDLSSGNANIDFYPEYNNRNGYGDNSSNSTHSGYALDHCWIRRLMLVEEFRNAYVDYYYSNEVQNYIEKIYGANDTESIINGFNEKYRPFIDDNNEVWPLNQTQGGLEKIPALNNTYDMELDFLRNWFEERHHWLNEYYFDKYKHQTVMVQENFDKKEKDAPFRLNCDLYGEGELSFTSDNEAVATVNQTGLVTVKGPGTAHITIGISESGAYKASSRIVTVNVAKEVKEEPSTEKPSVQPVPTATAKPVGQLTAPRKVTGLKVKSLGKGKVSVKWKQISKVTGYQVWYKQGKKAITKTVKGASKTSLKITKLKKNKKCLIKVRAYNKKGKTVKYGKWSAQKKINRVK